jgi:SAM-dependent methyltransferase
MLTKSSKYASSYTSEQWQKDLVAKITEFIRLNVSWINNDLITVQSAENSVHTQRKPFRVLDYACGPGTVTNALYSYATECIGIDLSENMVETYNARFTTQTTEQLPIAHAVVGNLLEETSLEAFSNPEFFNFDLVIIGLGFHHLENPKLATERLVERLKPGGVFAIIDFITHPKEHGPAIHTVAHHGFSEIQIRDILSEAGLDDIGFRQMDGEVQIRNMSSRKPFLAKGRKP